MAAKVDGREIIVETLLMITRDGEYSHIALKQVLDKYQYLEKRERAFITRVVDGTLERMIEMDYIIGKFSSVKINKMKPIIRAILRSSVYQLKYMDGVPASAVCNEAVNLAVKKGFRGLKGFVNGVLRNISRNLDDISYPEEKNMEEYLSVTYSLPKWLVTQWLKDYSADKVASMGEAFLGAKPTTIRVNQQKKSKEEMVRLLEELGVHVIEDSNIPYALHITGYDHLAALPGFEEGWFSVQDISSMEVARWADPQEGDYIIDVCAAPGGKAMHLAELLKGTGMVEARDLTEYKVSLLRENISRMGFSNIKAVQMDATVLDESSVETADIVIADLPCSGLGVLGKKPDLKYKMTEEMQKQLVELQRQILAVVHQYVKPGGKLIYSTCTIHKGENEENAAWFAKEYPGFTLQKEQQILPSTEGGDGFYLASFKKGEV